MFFKLFYECSKARSFQNELMFSVPMYTIVTTIFMYCVIELTTNAPDGILAGK